MEKYKPFKFFGTWIRATHLLEDLFPSFIELLEELEKGGSLSISKDFKDKSTWDDELLHDLLDALNEYAPPFCYFGAHEGDGSDFGFWVDINYIEDCTHSCELLQTSDLAEIPGDFCGDAVVINDHGNMSLYRAGIDSKGEQTLTEIWAVV